MSKNKLLIPTPTPVVHARNQPIIKFYSILPWNIPRIELFLTTSVAPKPQLFLSSKLLYFKMFMLKKWKRGWLWTNTVIEFRLTLLVTQQSNKRPLLRQATVTLFEKTANREWWWTHVPKNNLAWIRIQASFILKREGIKSNISWFPSGSRRDVFRSSSLQSFMGGPGQDISCELNKGILA